MSRYRIRVAGVVVDTVETETPGQVLRQAVEGLTTLTNLYGPTYRAINDVLHAAREAGPTVADEEMLAEIEQVRTDFVLGHRAAIRRLQTTINEIVPGSYPIDEDAPLQSGDVPCATMLAAAGIMAAVAIAAATTGAGLPVAAGAAAASGFLIGYTGAAESDGACA